MPKSANRGWYRDFFTDHPGFQTNHPDALLGTGSSAKAKVYCTNCFEQDIIAILGEDQADIEAYPPRRNRVREVSEIESYRKFLMLISIHCYY